MSKVLMLVGLALALSLPTYTQTKAGTAADEAAILKNRDAQNAAYNSHDGKAYAALMAIDADRVDAAGTLTGRAQIEKYYSGLFADTTRTVKDELRKVRFITSDTALLDVDNAVTSRTGTNRNHGVDLRQAERPVGVRCTTRHSEAVDGGAAAQLANEVTDST